MKSLSLSTFTGRRVDLSVSEGEPAVTAIEDPVCRLAGFRNAQRLAPHLRTAGDGNGDDECANAQIATGKVFVSI